MTPGEAVGELSSQIVTVVSCDTRHGNFHSKDLFALVTALRPFGQNGVCPVLFLYVLVC